MPRTTYAGSRSCPMGRRPRVMPAHPPGSAWLTAQAMAISQMGAGNGSLQPEQRICKIAGHVTSDPGRSRTRGNSEPFHGALLSEARHHRTFVWCDLQWRERRRASDCGQCPAGLSALLHESVKRRDKAVGAHLSQLWSLMYLHAMSLRFVVISTGPASSRDVRMSQGRAQESVVRC
jgi:hypothetical protein